MIGIFIDPPGSYTQGKFLRRLHILIKKWSGEQKWHIRSYWMPGMGVVDNASNENNENTRRKATVVPIKIEYV